MTDDLHTRAAEVKMTVARSGRHYLLADRWGTWLEVDGSHLLTRDQAEDLISEETRRRHRLNMEFHKP